MKETYHITRYSIIRNNQVRLNGELLFESRERSTPGMLTSVYRHFDIPYAKFFKMDNLCKLGFLASEILLRGWAPGQDYKAGDIGIVLSNASSSIDADRSHQQSIANRDLYFPSPSVFVYTLANIVIGEICIRHKLQGEGMFFIEEAFNPDILYNSVQQVLDDGVARSCITGWVEVNGSKYEAVLYFIEKQASHKSGIAIFDAANLLNLYQQTI